MTVAGSGSAAWFPEPSRADDTYANRGELVTDWLKRSTVPRAREVRRFLTYRFGPPPASGSAGSPSQGGLFGDALKNGRESITPDTNAPTLTVLAVK